VSSGGGLLSGSPFGSGAAASAAPDPFGGATEFGFSIPQGNPTEIDMAGRACITRWMTLGMQSENVSNAARTAVAGWQGGAQTAFSDYAGHDDKCPIVGFMIDEDEQPIEYESLETMVATLADCFDQGAFFVDDRGHLSMDSGRHREIARAHNPTVAIWGAN
jgi:hypothetical protein